MNDAIIGGAIAAVLGATGGAITAILLERRREKKQQLRIVNALIVDVKQNLRICKELKENALWWTSIFNLEAYDAYKGQLSFLREDVRVKLAGAVFDMKNRNTTSQIMQQAAAVGHNFDMKPIPTPKNLIGQLELVNAELRKWRHEHTLSLWFRIRRRLRNLVSKIRKNSALLMI